MQLLHDAGSRLRSVHDGRNVPYLGLRIHRCAPKDFVATGSTSPCATYARRILISGALQTVECDVARNDIALESSVCNFYRKASCHDLLILHAVAYASLDVQVLPQWKPMKVSLCRIVEFALDGLLIHISRYGIVDVKQCYCIVAYAGSDKLT